jgi:hypothetical protein
MAEDETDELDIDDTLATETADEQPTVDTPETEIDAEDEVVVTLGEEQPPQEEPEHSPNLVNKLRKMHREATKRIRELEAKQAVEPAPQAPTLGAKPTLEASDYDADKFEQALTSWHEQKRKVEEAEVKVKREQADAQKTWQGTLDAYGKAKTELKVRDFDEAEEAVIEALSSTQQGIILSGAKTPAELIYALGKNPKALKSLSEVKDPVKFAFAVADLQKDLKVSKRSDIPAPERSIRSTAPVSGSVDSTLERLRTEARKSGDYTKVTAYKEKLKRHSA